MHWSLTTGCNPVHPSKITFYILAFGVPAFSTTSTFMRRMGLHTTDAMICILTCMPTSATGSYLVRLLVSIFVFFIIFRITFANHNMSLIWVGKINKKLSYPQRKCASNVAILYGADGISI